MNQGFIMFPEYIKPKAYNKHQNSEVHEHFTHSFLSIIYGIITKTLKDKLDETTDKREYNEIIENKTLNKRGTTQTNRPQYSEMYEQRKSKVDLAQNKKPDSNMSQRKETMYSNCVTERVSNAFTQRQPTMYSSRENLYISENAVSDNPTFSSSETPQHVKSCNINEINNYLRYSDHNKSVESKIHPDEQINTKYIQKGGYVASKISRNASMTNISSKNYNLFKKSNRSKSRIENVSNKRKSLSSLKAMNKHFALPTASYINTTKSKELINVCHANLKRMSYGYDSVLNDSTNRIGNCGEYSYKIINKNIQIYE